MTPHLTILLIYAAALMGLGVWIGRRVRHSADFFVAGRRLGPFLLFATLLAANIGTGSTVGAAGLAYRDGLSVWWWVGSAGLGSLVLAFWVGPAVRRIAARHDLRTVGDFLELRYGQPVRMTIAALFWIATLSILAGQIVGMSRVLGAVTGLDFRAGCIVGGVVVTVYFAAGGLRTAAWVNVVQLVVLLVGFGLALPFGLAAAGGWERITEATGAVPGYWNFWEGGGSGWFYVVMLGPAFVVSPGLLQKIYGARNDSAVRTGVALNAVALLLFAAVPVLLGMMARTAYPDLPAPDQALPTLLRDALPPLLGGLGLAALFSAEISSADAILFMLSTSLSQDLYRRVLDPAASEARVLAVARTAAAAGGAAGIALALVFQTIIGALSFFYTILTVSLFIPVLAGLYLRRVGMPEILGSIAAGVSVVIVLQVARGGQGIGAFTPAMIGLAAALAGCLAVRGVWAARRSKGGSRP